MKICLRAKRFADPTKREQLLTRLSKRSFKVEHIDTPLASWVREERAAARAVSRRSITQKALALNGELGGDVSFRASRGWLEKFLNRLVLFAS